MKLPSVHYLYSHARSGMKRFPMTILSAVVATVTAIIMIEADHPDPDLHLFNLMLTGALGIPACLFAGLLSQRRFPAGNRRWVVYGTVALLLVLIYFSLPVTAHNTFQPYIRYVIYNIIFHLAVAFAPYLETGELNGFWNYNKSLFLRFLAALLYSGVLYGGLALAMVTVDTLFDTNIDPKRYLELFTIVIWIFNTWFFVSGLPRDFRALDAETQYPRGLKIFTQYILIPLLAVYLVILYTYGIKIILTWDWPRGVVSYLIMVVAVAGILTMLLIHPYARQSDSRWIHHARKGYYLLLYPLVILLFIAIWIRIADYGITVNRYIIVVTGLWILIASTYSLFRPLQIKFIPISLAVILLLVSFGPWGMFAVAERAQIGRMKAILSSAKILENGKINREVIWETDSLPEFDSDNRLTNNDILSDSLHNEVYSIVHYLGKYHGFTGIGSWFGQDIDSLLAVADSMVPDSIHYGRPYDQEEDIYMSSMGLQNYLKYTDNYNHAYRSFDRKQLLRYSMENFDGLIDIGPVSFRTFQQEMIQIYKVTKMHGEQKYTIRLDSSLTTLAFRTDSLSFTFHIEDQLKRVQHMNLVNEQREVIPDAFMEVESDDRSARLIILNLQTYQDPQYPENKVILSDLTGLIFFRQPKP